METLDQNISSRIKRLVNTKNDSFTINEPELINYIKSTEFQIYQNLKTIDGVNKRILFCRNKLKINFRVISLIVFYKKDALTQNVAS